MTQYRFLETPSHSRYRLASNAIVPTAYGVGTPTFVGGLTSTALTENTSATLANPERGIFYYTETHYAAETGSYSLGSPLTVGDLAANATANGYTIVYRYFYMEVYNSNGSVISPAYKALVAADIATCRAAGVKLVLRFAYLNYTGSTYTPPYGDGPNVATVEAHVAALMPLINPNGDVVLAIEAGFIGFWGEWYYTDNFCTSEVPGTPNGTDWTNRTAVLNAIVNGTSTANCFVLVRYCGVKQTIYPSDTTRIGFHDDAFADPFADYGTFDTFSAEPPNTTASNEAYLTAQTALPLLLMGEGAGAVSPGTDFPSASAQLAAYHWTSLNQYTPGSYSWNSTDTNTAQTLLGYRLVGSAVRAQASIAPGANMRIEIDFANNGYAAPVSNREVVLVLDNQAGTRYNIPLAEDFRQFTPGNSFTLWATLPLPGGMPAGTYYVALWFPDSAPGLTANGSYAVQLANTGTWNGSYGYNQLTTVTIT